MRWPQLDSRDALPCKLSLDEWKKLAPYLAIRFLQAGDVLMHEGESVRELFILAEGELHVTTERHRSGPPGTGHGGGRGQLSFRASRAAPP
jgi:CRP-like cAMP-binding protein